MRWLWLLFLPVLFLPNLGLASTTGFGTLEISDFFVGPYLLLVLLALFTARKKRRPALSDRTFALMIVFLGWATLSTLTMLVRYEYTSTYQLEFSLLKIGKFGLYAIAGMLTVRALATENRFKQFNWSITVAAIVVGLSLFILQFSDSAAVSSPDASQGYGANNQVSVMMAMLLSYLSGLLLTAHGSRKWRKFAKLALVIGLAGMLVSQGRGGWIAMLAGFGILSHRRGVDPKVIVLATILTAVAVIGYQQLEIFQEEVDLTLRMGDYEGFTQAGATESVDDGGRIHHWQSEGAKILNAPVFGTGFFHRGGQSGLWWTGSHNFWIQMFLETGLVGGLLMLAFFSRMWKQARRVAAQSLERGLSTEAALVAGLVGGMGGEYFYGGVGLLVVFLVYAPVGACLDGSRSR